MMFNWWKPKQEKKMAKKNVVTFTSGETPKPKRLASGFIGFRPSVPFSVPANSSKDVKLEISADVVLLTETGNLIAPGQLITLTVYNKTTSTVNYETTDVIGRALPIFAVDYDVA
jgi:hypothetical protein